MESLPRLLICDDDPKMADSIKAVLKDGKYEIEVTHSSCSALERIQAQIPDLVLLDLMMPEMDGFEILDAVDREQCDTDFIVITGWASVDSAVTAIRKGASDYLRKPFEPEELIIRVETVLRQRRSRHANLSYEAEKRNLQDQLRQSQKMEAIGTLAGGIAHDFNNVLSIILGNTELALAGLSGGQAARLNLERILTASLRAREMVQQLLSFSRKEESGKKKVRLNSLISESLKLMRASLPTNIIINCDLCDGSCNIFADATQIHQIILNLCTNAAHAMEKDGGILTIRLEPAVLDDAAAAQIDNLPPGDYARIVVADTGHGIDPAIIEQIFDPYFTTKEIGKGTGMGLSVVRSIVRNSGGAIQAFSQPGLFTEFHLYLPTVDGPCETEPAEPDDNQLPGGIERIMIIDDEEMLVDMMRQVLEQLGYTVDVYTESRRALEAFLARPNDVDLIITDMTMPGMNGTGLASAVHTVRQDIPVILCTGYNGRINPENAKSLGIQALIMKPVSMRQLAETIRNVLSPASTERRKTPRYQAIKGAFVISNNHPSHRCRLVDIGAGGLAFRHCLPQVAQSDHDRLSIVAPDGTLFLYELGCRTVAEMPACSGTCPDESDTTRRSVCFEGLTTMQKERIDRFIRDFTAEPIV